MVGDDRLLGEDVPLGLLSGRLHGLRLWFDELIGCEALFGLWPNEV